MHLLGLSRRAHRIGVVCALVIHLLFALLFLWVGDSSSVKKTVNWNVDIVKIAAPIVQPISQPKAVTSQLIKARQPVKVSPPKTVIAKKVVAPPKVAPVKSLAKPKIVPPDALALRKKMSRKQRQESLAKERLQQKKLVAARLKQERLAKERLQQKKLVAERLKQERLEQARLEREKLEQARRERERLEQERLQRLRQAQILAARAADSLAQARPKASPQRHSKGDDNHYFLRVARLLRKNLKFDTRPFEGSNPTAKVAITLNSQGEIAALKIIRSSGVTTFDERIVKGLKALGKLPPRKDGTYPSNLPLQYRMFP